MNIPSQGKLGDKPMKPFDDNRNRNGDRGSPCRIPLVGLMNPFGAPLMGIE